MAPNHAHSHRRSKLVVVGTVLASGIVLSVMAYHFAARSERELRRIELVEQADLRIRALGQRLRRAMNANMAPITQIQKDAQDGQTMFRHLANARLSSNNDIQTLMWVPRVPIEDLETHEQAARAYGLSNYHVHPHDDASNPRRDCYPVYFVEPHADNLTTLGLDLATVPQLRLAIEQAINNGGAAMSRPILWRDDTGESLTVFVFRALNRPPRAPNVPDTSHDVLLGFAVTVVRAGAMIEDALGPFEPEIDIVVSGSFDDGPLEPLLVYDSKTRRALPIDPGSKPRASDTAATPTRQITLPGRRWSAYGLPTAALRNRQRSAVPLLILLAGLLITGIITAYLNTIIGRSAKIQELVVRRTAQLEEANRDLSRERFLLGTLLNQSPDFIYFKDKDSRYLRISRALADYFGLPDPDAACGKTDFDNFPEQLAKQFRDDELQIMQTGAPVIDKEEYQDNASGQHFWLSTSKVPLRNEQDEVIGTFGISRDITRRKNAEIELAEAKSAAEAANRAKSEFVANMSHEIRTPMNAVIGLTELVLDSNLTDSQREYLKMVLESAESLLAIINDILDFSKIEAGKLELERTPFELRELIGDSLKSLAFRAHHKGLELACRVAPEIPDQLKGDPGRLRQVIVNLIGNAIKFTDKGEVVLDLACENCTEDRVQLHAVVRDTGIGVSQEQQTGIFDAFHQADSSSTRRFGGSGLGLTICSRLVDMMGGRIWVDSRPGQGSQFHFTAQFIAVDEDQEATPSTTLIGTPILVVDDNQSNLKILDEVLADWGLIPTCAGSAPQAIQLAREACEEGRPFPILLVDAGMPETDGFSLAESIHADPDLSCQIIMMLTSETQPRDLSRDRDLGITSCLLKPVKESELFHAVFSSLGIRRLDDATPTDQSRKSPTLPPLRILLVEDSLVNQKLAVGLLAKYGHHVVVANHGREAVEVFDAQPFDLVLMDIQMPEMDGFEATEAIRAKQNGRPHPTPVIAMTAHAMKGDRERCLQAGMDGYVAKPIRAAVLFHTITKVLDRVIR